MEVAASQSAPLQAEFVEWWFAPWDYAASWPQDLVLPHGLVGKRAAYALWCEAAGVQAQFPARVNPAWQTTALRHRDQLEAVVELFAGLLAARENDLKNLQALDPVDRRWCMSIAALQPLLALAAGGLIDDVKPTLLQRGLLETRAWLEAGFPGMWSRLRHLLAPQQALALDQVAALDRDPDDISAAAVKRAQRCWQLCLDRVQTAQYDETGDDELDEHDRSDSRSAIQAQKPIKKRA